MASEISGTTYFGLHLSACGQRFPGASIAVLANYSENLYPPVPEPTFRNYIFKLLNPDVELVDWTHREKFDLVVHGGGGNFFDVSRGSLRDEWLGSIVRLVGAPLYSSLMRLPRALARKTRMSAQLATWTGLGRGSICEGCWSPARRGLRCSAHSIALPFGTPTV